MKTIVGLFDARSDANSVVHDLVNLGIDREDIGMVANDPNSTSTLNDWKMSDKSESTLDHRYAMVTDGAAADGAILGATIGGVGGILLSLSALAIPGVGPVVAAGPLLTGLIGAGVGAAVGGLVGALIEAGVPEEQAGYFNEGVRRGGTLVSVKANEEDVEEIMEIMNRYHPVDIDQRVSDWRAEGWSDPSTYDDSDFRTHYQSTYAHSGRAYDEYAPAYRYGYGLRNDINYKERSWSEIENEIRRDWNTKNAGRNWEDFKDAVRRGWERTKEAVRM